MIAQLRRETGFNWGYLKFPRQQFVKKVRLRVRVRARVRVRVRARVRVRTRARDRDSKG